MELWLLVSLLISSAYMEYEVMLVDQLLDGQK